MTCVMLQLLGYVSLGYVKNNLSVEIPPFESRVILFYSLNECLDSDPSPSELMYTTATRHRSVGLQLVYCEGSIRMLRV